MMRHGWLICYARRNKELRSMVSVCVRAGLDIPLMMHGESMSKNDLRQKEEKLQDYFLYEMRKAPYRAK